MKNLISDVYDNIEELEKKYYNKEYVVVNSHTTGDCVSHSVYIFPNHINACDVRGKLNAFPSTVRLFKGNSRINEIEFNSSNWNEKVVMAIVSDCWGRYDIDIFI